MSEEVSCLPQMPMWLHSLDTRDRLRPSNNIINSQFSLVSQTIIKQRTNKPIGWVKVVYNLPTTARSYGGGRASVLINRLQAVELRKAALALSCLFLLCEDLDFQSYSGGIIFQITLYNILLLLLILRVRRPRDMGTRPVYIVYTPPHPPTLQPLHAGV